MKALSIIALFAVLAFIGFRLGYAAYEHKQLQVEVVDAMGRYLLESGRDIEKDVRRAVDERNGKIVPETLRFEFDFNVGEGKCWFEYQRKISLLVATYAKTYSVYEEVSKKRLYRIKRDVENKLKQSTQRADQPNLVQ